MQTLPLWIKARMWWDYLKYVVFLQQGESLKLGAEVLIFLLSIYLLNFELFLKKSENHGEEAISLVVILIIFKFFWEIYETRLQVKSYFNIHHSILRNPAGIGDLHPGEREKNLGFIAVEIKEPKPDLVFVSQKLNLYLQTTPLKISMSDSKNKHIKSYLQRHRDVLLQYLNYYFFSSLKHNRQFTNDEKFCLSKDIALNTAHVSCHKAGYFDSFLTNQTTGTTLVIQDNKHTTISTEHIFPADTDPEGHRILSDVNSSSMNNHIGCSTLGISLDHKIIVWEQGKTTQFSRGLLTPTGSGSANASDIEGQDFQKTLVTAMERELREESNPDKSLIGVQNKTKILGFYRWVSRGGKPEFIGLTKLPGNADMYKPGIGEVRSEKSAIHHHFEIKTIDQIPTAISQIRRTGTLSIPLFMCLYQLEEMYKTQKEELETFIFNS